MVIFEENGTPGKCCTVCGIWKPLEHYRTRKPGVGDGYFSQCKACELARRRAKRAENPMPHRERAQQWKWEHPEQTQRARDRWREANREEERARARAARLEDPEKKQQQNRAYYALNYGRLHTRQKQRRTEHPQLAREHSRRWRQRHPDKVKALKRRRRARLALTPGAHTEAQWQALKARYDHRCLRCGRREPEITLQRDHVIPLGLHGSSDDIANIQPLCGPCNAWKKRRVIDFRSPHSAR